MTDREKRHKGITAFLVPTDARASPAASRTTSSGIRASGSCTIFFENCASPRAAGSARRATGFKVAMATLDGGRIGIAAQALGIARAALRGGASRTRRSARRSASPSRSFQAIQFMLADMATELDAARLLIWRAATLKDQGVRHTRRARWRSSTRPRWRAGHPQGAPDPRRLRLHEGVRRRAPLARRRITEIYEGTSEIQRIVISSAVLKD